VATLQQDTNVRDHQIDVRDYRMYIAGRWVEAESGGTYTVLNPATEEVIARVPKGTKDDAEAAVQAARKAFDEGPWGKTTAYERSQYLRAIAAKIREKRDLLARLETENMGKLIDDSYVDMDDAADAFDYYAGLVMRQHGETVNVPVADSVSMVVREPFGVTVGITPWNYPLLMAVWKAAPSLAAGNTVIIKPPSITPLTTLELGRITEEVGLPEGVFNVVTGPGGEVGDYLAGHPQVDKVAFTGSVEVGKHIMRRAAENVKKVTLELGGKGPNIIFADADWEQAMQGALSGIFANTGQVCSAGSRLIVQRDIYDRFVDELVRRARHLKVGPGDDASVEMGPLVSADQLERVDGYVKIGQDEGAQLATGGHRIGSRGYFYEPTIFVDVDNRMRVAQEEIFGPVLVVMPFETEEEAIEIANDTIYGLAGAVFTKDIDKAMRVVKRLRMGITWVNVYHPTYNEQPWGGYKQSGIGRELGPNGLDEYSEIKQINIDISGKPVGAYQAAKKAAEAQALGSVRKEKAA